MGNEKYISLDRQKLIKEILDKKYVIVDKFNQIYTTRTGGKNHPKRLKLSKGTVSEKGYLYMGVHINKKIHTFYQHHIIWINFNGFIQEKLQVNHINGIKHHNELSNLELMTPLENIKHGHELGLFDNIYGENNHNNKLTKEQVKYIRKTYIPHNRTFGGRALGKKFNVTHGVISAIVTNKMWKNNSYKIKNKYALKDNHLTGIRLNKKTNKWEAYYYKNHKKYHLGIFNDINDAITKRNKAVKNNLDVYVLIEKPKNDTVINLIEGK